MKISRERYARLYGPTTGDRLRLADTGLIVEIERDLTGYGDELSFGGGKVIRDAMGQHPTISRAEGALDTVITNAIVIDATGIYKATSACAMAASPASAKPATRTSWKASRPG